MRRKDPGILQFFSDFPTQREPGGKVFLGHFLPELLLNVQKKTETSATALELGFELIENLLDFGQLPGMVGCREEPLLKFSHMFQHRVYPLRSDTTYHTLGAIARAAVQSYQNRHIFATRFSL